MREGEHGAAAVEFALILPVLMLVLIGIIEFSFAFNTQLSLSQAAREGARHMVLTNDPGASATAAKNAAGRLDPSTVTVTFTFSGGGSVCSAGKQVTATTSNTLQTVTGFISGFAGNIVLTSKGTMLCAA